MLINGLGKKISAISAPTSFEQIARGTTSTNQAGVVKPQPQNRGAKAARRSRQRGKKG